MPYILDRDGLEYYHRRRKGVLFEDLYDVTFIGDYNVNQTTVAKLKLRKESSGVQTSTNDIEFPIVYCEAEVTPDTGYTAGEATITREGNLFIVDVDSANKSANELDIGFTGEPNSELANGDTLSLSININVIGTSEENRYDILRDGTVIGSYNVPSLVDDSFTSVFEYVVTQEDIDNGSVTFTLVDSSNGATVDSITLYAEEASPEISVAFSASPTHNINIGDNFTQELVVYNSGNVTLTDIVVSSNFVTINVPSGTSIPPGQSITLTNTVTAQPSMGTLNSSGDSYTIVGNVSVNASSVRGDATQTSYGTYTIIADKATSTVSATSEDITKGEDGTITAIVSNGATGTCTITIGSSNYTATVVGGTATILIPNLSEGKYTAYVTYNGDDYYKSSTTSTQFSVTAPQKKQVTITTTSSVFSYNGTAMNENDYSIEGVIGDDEIKVTFPSGGYIEPGTYENTATYEIISDLDAREEGYDGYEVEMVYGTITILDEGSAPDIPTPPTPPTP